jgi:hypothetical protein
MEVTGKKESNPDETLNEADTKTNKGSDDEHLQKRLSNDAVNERANPADSSGNKRGYISENSRHRKTSLHPDETLNKADTETNKGDDNESLNQRIGSDSTDERTDPSHGRSNHATRIGEDSGKGTSGRSSSIAYHLSNIFAERYIQAIWIKSRMILIVRIAKAKPMK